VEVNHFKKVNNEKLMVIDDAMKTVEKKRKDLAF